MDPNCKERVGSFFTICAFGIWLYVALFLRAPMNLLLVYIACSGSPASDVISTAGDAEQARAALIPECDGVVHDANLFSECALQHVTRARTAEDAIELCGRLDGQAGRCRATWVGRMMNRVDAADLRKVCGEDAACLESVDAVHAWKETNGDSKAPTAQPTN